MGKKKKILIAIVLISVLVWIIVKTPYSSKFEQQLNNGSIFILEKNQVFIEADQEIVSFDSEDPFCIEMIEHLQEYPSNLPKLIYDKCALEEGIK